MDLSTRNHHFPPHVLTNILLEHLLLRSDPTFRRAFPLLYPQTLFVMNAIEISFSGTGTIGANRPSGSPSASPNAGPSVDASLIVLSLAPLPARLPVLVLVLRLDLALDPRQVQAPVSTRILRPVLLLAPFLV
jgi:hypothetical protein